MQHTWVKRSPPPPHAEALASEPKHRDEDVPRTPWGSSAAVVNREIPSLLVVATGDQCPVSGRCIQRVHWALMQAKFHEHGRAGLRIIHAHIACLDIAELTTYRSDAAKTALLNS